MITNWIEEDRGHDTPCWVWQGAMSGGRYAAVVVGGQTRPAHVVFYEDQVGPVPDGMELDHLCRVTQYVRPLHMEPVTHQENVRRSDSPFGVNARKTHCPRGHELTAENTLTRKRKVRDCLTSHRDRERARRAAARSI